MNEFGREGNASSVTILGPFVNRQLLNERNTQMLFTNLYMLLGISIDSNTLQQ